MMCEKWEMWWLMTSVCCPSPRWNHCCTKLWVTIFCFWTPYIFIHTTYKKQSHLHICRGRFALTSSYWDSNSAKQTGNSQKSCTWRIYVHRAKLSVNQEVKRRDAGWGRLVTWSVDCLLSGFKARYNKTEYFSILLPNFCIFLIHYYY